MEICYIFSSSDYSKFLKVEDNSLLIHKSAYLLFSVLM